MRILKNTQSGVAGEQSVIAILLRFGLKVSKPYWNDDEVDFEIKYGEGDKSINIPLQVKTVQFSDSKNKAFIQGLKKKYVERNELLCLAIYNPQNDWMWFLTGSKEIISKYESQCKWNKKHETYSSLKTGKDIRIAVPKNGLDFITESKINSGDGNRLYGLINRIAERKVVTIIPEDKNDLVDLKSKIKVHISTNHRRNIILEPTNFLIEGTIPNIVPIIYNLFQEFINENNFERDLLILFRELFINSIAHRSYRDNSANTVELSDEIIRISNPGGLVKELSLHDLLSKSIVVQRNPKLSYELVKIGLMQSMGSGIYIATKIKSTIPKWRLFFKIDNDVFTAEIIKNSKV